MDKKLDLQEPTEEELEDVLKQIAKFTQEFVTAAIKALKKLRVGDFISYKGGIYEVVEIKGTWLSVVRIDKKPVDFYRTESLVPPQQVVKLKNKKLIRRLYK